ncbi:MAG: PsbP-related protein [Nitrososphaeraceae archaeon]
MNNFISFAVVAIMLSVPLYSLSAFGADNATSNKSQITEDQFVTYDNSTRGIKIDYPKGWTVIDQFGLGFFSPKENDSDTFQEGLLVSKGPHGNQSIDKLAAGVLAIYNSSLPNFKLIESKGLTFHGNPAQNLIYTFNPGNGTIKVLESGATENNSIYIFQYRAQENKFDSYLPTIQRMIDSFKATK